MANSDSIPYPPWSAPASLEGGKKSKWGWFRRSGKKKKKDSKQSPASPSRQPSMEDRYNMNPFAPRPNPFQMGGRLPNQYVSPGSPFVNYAPREVRRPRPPSPLEEPRGIFDPDALVGRTNRPPLANVFPMYDSPKLAPARSRKVSHERRHSVPTTSLSPPEQPRRPSRTSASSDGSNERSNRRDRRAKALRAIPVLPNQHRAEKKSVYNAPYRQPSPIEYPPYPPHSQNLIHSPSFPPWPQPHEQLLELQEELDEEEEVDGGEDPLNQIDETPRKSREVKPKKLQHINRVDDGNEDIKGFDGFMMY